MSIEQKYEAACRCILEECTQMLSRIDPRQTEAFIDLLCGARRVFFIGVGRVMLSLEALAKRLGHLGIETHIVGDINEPSFSKEDLLVVASGSGESIVPVAIAKKAKSIGGKIVHIGSNPIGTVAQLADLQVRIPAQTKLALPDEFRSNQAMTSLFEQTLLLYGDAVAAVIIESRHLDIHTLWDTHANLE